MKLLFCCVVFYFGIFLHVTGEQNFIVKGFYNFGLIADQDKQSKVVGENKWRSFFYPGNLVLGTVFKEGMFFAELSMDKKGPQPVDSDLNENGRGMELSELLWFNNKLYAMDDRTGTVFELVKNGTTYKPVPWVTLQDGNGTSSKRFKCEWASIKDEHMWVGSTGQTWLNSDGTVASEGPQYVKKISNTGKIQHLDWRLNYKKMAAAMGIYPPGYVIHEAAQWSQKLSKWIFIPRKSSNLPYNDKRNELLGASVLLMADENFNDIKVTQIQGASPLTGFSSFKILPGLDDTKLVALKTQEIDDKFQTYITVLDIYGNRLYRDMLVDTKKYEGFEFMNSSSFKPNEFPG